MGVKADLKAARARMQSGEHGQALSMIEKILDDGSPELQDAQTLYAVLVSAGLAGLAAADLHAAERSFRRATESLPGSPQAWKGLIDCLERAGKVEDLPECLSCAAGIAEGKGNHARALPLLLRLGEVLDGLGRPGEALQALRRYLDNPEAVAAVAGVASSAEERLSVSLLSAVLEVSREDAEVSERVKRRLMKDNGGSGSTADFTFQYRKKALIKDDDEGGSVGKSITGAMRALKEAVPTGLLAPDDTSEPRHPKPLQALVTRFCRTFLRRAIERAESTGGCGSTWENVAAASATVREAVGSTDWDDGWADAVHLMSSAYYQPPDSTTKLQRMATDNTSDDLHPWLTEESCIYLAAVAVSAGDGMEGAKLLDTAAAADAAATLERKALHGNSALWPEMSGRGSDWRELSLRCLVDELLGYPGAVRSPVIALRQIDSAMAAYEDSLGARGPPVAFSIFDLQGSLALARASLLLKLGRLDDSRTAIFNATQANLEAEKASEAGMVSGKKLSEASATTRGLSSQTLVHMRAICVESDVDIAEGNAEEAKKKLEKVLEATDGNFADALSRLGWMVLLGNVDINPESAACAEGRTEAARPFLEKAVAQEPASSLHAFRLARWILERLSVVYINIICLSTNMLEIWVIHRVCLFKYWMVILFVVSGGWPCTGATGRPAVISERIGSTALILSSRRPSLILPTLRWETPQVAAAYFWHSNNQLLSLLLLLFL